MNAKQVRKLLDDVCADLDRRRAEMSAMVGRCARPVGFGLALGLGGIAGCASDSGPDRAVDAYGVTMNFDASPDNQDAGIDRPVDAYGVTTSFEVSPDNKNAGIDHPVDAYGVTVDVAETGDSLRNDVSDAKEILDSSPGVDGGIDAGSVEKPELDAGASADTGHVDGGAID